MELREELDFVGRRVDQLVDNVTRVAECLEGNMEMTRELLELFSKLHERIIRLEINERKESLWKGGLERRRSFEPPHQVESPEPEPEPELELEEEGYDLPPRPPPRPVRQAGQAYPALPTRPHVSVSEPSERYRPSSRVPASLRDLPRSEKVLGRSKGCF